MARRQKWATDHRALVLESVATAPRGATRPSVIEDCVGEGFTRSMVLVMLWQLKREGLVGESDEVLFLTRAGFDWLTQGRFDRPLPEPGHPRPGARKRFPKNDS
jgi:hypothetical protein